MGYATYSAKVRVGHTAGERSGWASDTAITCVVSQGSAVTRMTTLTVGVNNGGTISISLSYNIPTLFTPRFFR
jgi:hypothetical protein